MGVKTLAQALMVTLVLPVQLMGLASYQQAVKHTLFCKVVMFTPADNSRCK